MAVAFRAAVPADYQAICDLIRDPDELFLVYPKGKYPLTTKQLERLLERRIEPTVMLRKQEGKQDELAGFAALYGYRKGRSVYIGNVIVDRLRRGRGLGREIVAHLMGLAFERYDLPSVRISVYSYNTTALLLYRSLGFAPYAVQERKDWRGERVALLHMSRAREARSSTRPSPDSLERVRR